MAESERFLRAVESIHAAGLEGGRWDGALAAIADLFGSLGATLEVFEKQPLRLIDLHVAGLPPIAETEYLNHYAMHNPRASYAFRHLSDVTLCDYQIIDERSMDRDAYYAKYLRSLDLRYFLSGQIMNTARIQGVVTIQRSRRQGHVEQRDIERMQKLLPHVRQAYDVATALGAARSETRSLAEALNWLDDGVALLGEDGEVIHANEALLDIARRPGGEIRIASRRLEFAAAEASGRFAKALGGTGYGRRAGGQGAANFPVERQTGAPAYMVSVRPAIWGDAVEGTAPTCAAIVFVRDPCRPDVFALASLQGTFGLTDAEALFSKALLSGVSPAEYARAQRLSPNTVYTHLRRIKEKAQCAHLPELIHRLNEAVPSVRADRVQ